MSVQYVPVKWNANKRAYDFFIIAGISLYLALFILLGTWLGTGANSIGAIVLVMRGFGTCAFLLLHLVLCIGPLARFDRRFLPLLYNRRHLGVATFLMSLGHAVLAIGYYHGFGAINPFLSLLTSNTNYDSIAAFPFEILGLLALLVLFLMAATSHDFWQKNLSPSVWKGLHMLVYPAYGLLVMHVALGALQSEVNWLYPALLGLGISAVIGLHLYAGWCERRREGAGAMSGKIALNVSWIDVGHVDEIVDSRAKVVCIPGAERVAVFRHGRKISAVTNVCAHQRGPLGEGKIVDGCITCPWHGWNYRPEDGCSPPPFHERIATYHVRVEGRRIWLNPEPLASGTPVEPADFEEKPHG